MNNILVANSSLRANKRFSMLDAFFFALMSGAGEGYFVAFALELGIDPLQAGLLGTVPLFVGGVFQLFTPTLLARLTSYRKFIYISASLQALSFFPLVLCSYFNYVNFYLFLLINSIYWVFAFGVGQAWNALISGLIPSEERVGFFSTRNLLTYIGMFLGVIASGVGLEYGRLNGIAVSTFGIVFFVCMLARLASAFFLRCHTEPLALETKLDSKNLINFVKAFSHNSMGKTLLFNLAFKIAIYISAPFFVPFMLKELKLSYVSFMVIISASIVGKITISKNLSRIANKTSLFKIFLYSCIGICFVPVAWTLDKHVVYLFFMEVFSGVCWGSFEYSLFLIILNNIPRESQPRYMSVYNFSSAIAIIIGSLIGGLIFSSVSIGGNIYIIIFVISTVTRMCSLLLFPIDIKFPKIHLPVMTRPLSIRPNQGTVDRHVILKDHDM